MANNFRSPVNICIPRVPLAILKVIPLLLLMALGGLQTVGHAQTTFSVPFTYQIGGATPTPVTYSLTSDPSTTLTLVPDSATWVSSSLSSPTTPSTLTITIKPTGLTAGNYKSTLLVESSQGTLTYNITLAVTSGGALTLSSSSFTFSAVAGGTPPNSQTFTVTAQSSISTSVQTSEQSCTSQTWLSITPTGTFTASSTATTFTVSANPSGLAAGTCNGTITFTTASGTQTAAVTLNVTAAAGNSLTLSTSTLTFNAVAGGSSPASQTLNVTAQSSTGATVQMTEQSCATVTWLTISPQGSFTAGTTATTFTVSANQSGIAGGSTCSGTITFTTASGTQSVNVTLNVSAAATSVLTLGTSAFNFTATAGGFAPPSQTLVVSAQTVTAATAQASEQSCSASTWLILSPSGGFTASTTSTVFTVAVNQSGIAAGTICTGTISFVAASGTQTASVTLTVLGSSTPVLTLSTSALWFTGVVGLGAPPSQTFSVSARNIMSATAQVSEQSCASATWLTLLPSGSFTASTTATTFTVSVDQSGMVPGTICNGLIVVVASSYTQTIAVTMNVVNPAAGGNVTVSPPGPLSFNFNLGGLLPNAQTVLVSTAQGSSQIPFGVTPSASWIVTNAGTGTVGTPYPLQIGVDPSNLAASSTPYQGTITISPVGGTAISIPVNLNVIGSPTVSAAPTSLSFAYSAGSPNPQQQMVTVSGNGAAAPFSVVTSDSSWLHVSPACAPTSCVTPNTGTVGLIVTVDPTGLSAGATYSGTITIAGTGNATGTTNVSVTLSVAAPLPAINLVTNAASFITGPVSPGEVISIFGNPSFPIGPSTALSLSPATCPAKCTNVPTAMGGVKVIFQPGGVAAPLTFVSSTQVNCVVPYEMVGAASGSVTVSYLGQSSNSLVLQYSQTQPGIFTALGTGSGLASVLQYDATGNYQGQNSSSNPAGPGWYIVFYVTGEGIIPSPAITGQVINSTVVPLLGPPGVLIDNLASTVTYFAEAQGFVSGLMQVNAIIPLAVHTGQAVPLVLSMNGTNSQPGVVIYMR